MNIEFTCYVRPCPQGSMKAFVIRGGKRAGKAAVTSDNPKLKGFRQEVSIAALQARQSAGMATVVYPKHVPVRLTANFYFQKPESVPKKRELPVVKPDLDKLIRGLLDSLTGILWADDAQVVAAFGEKLYGLPERVEVQVCEAT